MDGAQDLSGGCLSLPRWKEKRRTLTCVSNLDLPSCLPPEHHRQLKPLSSHLILMLTRSSCFQPCENCQRSACTPFDLLLLSPLSSWTGFFAVCTTKTQKKVTLASKDFLNMTRLGGRCRDYPRTKLELALLPNPLPPFPDGPASPLPETHLQG